MLLNDDLLDALLPLAHALRRRVEAGQTFGLLIAHERCLQRRLVGQLVPTKTTWIIRPLLTRKGWGARRLLGTQRVRVACNIPRAARDLISTHSKQHVT